MHDMAKRLLILTIAMALTCATTAMANTVADRGIEQQEQLEERSISISVKGTSLTINGASGKTLEVVSLTGKKVTTVKITSPEQHVELNIQKGCYILKIGSVVRKVSIC